MKKLGAELGKMSQYYDYEMVVDHLTMAPIYEFVHKTTGKKYSYRINHIDLLDFGPDVVKMLAELKMEIREDKLNDLGL
jgi:hypothetical protein